MMVKALVENTSLSDDLGREHGLSLYIEMKDQKILFDVGAGDLFFKNAGKMGVDIADIDYLVISHGHYDHGGGLGKFFEENINAGVFIHCLAFNKYYARRPNNKIEYIGLAEALKQNRQITLTSNRHLIMQGIELFSNVPQVVPLPESNSSLLAEQDGEIVKDTFAHEQNLILEEDGKMVLLAGCAHSGIINIIEHFRMLKGQMPDFVIGGFHLVAPKTGDWDLGAVDQVGKYLLGTKAICYTGHCTGLEPYGRLKSMMGDKIHYLPTGGKIVI